MILTEIQTFLWGLPLFTALHVVEEFAYPGGFVKWMAVHNSTRLKQTWYYVAINAFAILGGACIALIANGVVGYCVFIWFVTFMAANGLSHIIASVQAGKYCPGSVTGILLFLPLFAASSWKFLAEGLINWQSWLLNAFSAIVVGYFFITVHSRRKVHNK